MHRVLRIFVHAALLLAKATRRGCTMRNRRRKKASSPFGNDMGMRLQVTKLSMCIVEELLERLPQWTDIQL